MTASEAAFKRTGQHNSFNGIHAAIQVTQIVCEHDVHLTHASLSADPGPENREMPPSLVLRHARKAAVNVR